MTAFLPDFLPEMLHGIHFALLLLHRPLISMFPVMYHLLVHHKLI